MKAKPDKRQEQQARELARLLIQRYGMNPKRLNIVIESGSAAVSTIDVKPLTDVRFIS